ncbi:MAG: Rnase Y domain-containing protein, partial [Candidatus Babeliales bacterium]
MPDNLTLFGVLSICFSIVLLAYARIRLVYAQRLVKKAQLKWDETQRDLDAERRESSLKLKDEIYKKRKEFELEVKRERMELDRLSERIALKYEELGKYEQRLEDQDRDSQKKERDLSRSQDVLRTNEARLKTVYNDLIKKLEMMSGMSRDEAKKALIETLEAEVTLSHEKWIQKVEDEARTIAKQKSIDITIACMQRYTAEHVTPHSSGIVELPNEEMKGRIIGKEGRNIKALELATGMEFVIGEVPEIITISGFNPVRREVARRALNKLVQDGRINPSRIEETVKQCEEEIAESIDEFGKQTVLEFNLQGLHPELVELL